VSKIPVRIDYVEQKRQPLQATPFSTELAGGFPYPPPEGAWKGGNEREDRSHPPNLVKCILYARFKTLKLQGFYFLWESEGDRDLHKSLELFLKGCQRALPPFVDFRFHLTQEKIQGSLSQDKA
jgi:hypothetical protein